ncbi:hypothetical protein [Roseomonas elaeocarpi]|uniref:Uncharacterized protein n=1 Tax=Roseomonas elaeocarpi TaxID=907779 RepID=A0ABV6JT18_9PROT
MILPVPVPMPRLHLLSGLTVALSLLCGGVLGISTALLGLAARRVSHMRHDRMA